MRRKRFKHITFTICHMFCGWRLVNSTKEINNLGTGVLKYNMIDDAVYFNDRKIEKPSICFELDAFLNEELKKLSFDKQIFDKIELTVDITQTIINSKKRITHDFHMSKNQQPINKGNFYRYELRCQCLIKTDDDEYIGRYEDVEEWPENWP